jgi:protein-L-isoaspartate(D-aspartate) O-methyltransferase
MVESQVRTSDVTDRSLLRAMLEIPRETFVPASMRELAYMDAEVRIASSVKGGAPRALMAPRTFAKLVQLAEIEASDIVLDVGTCTGYSAAVLARVAERVIALECDERLAEEATRLLRSLSIDNATVIRSDLAEGHVEESPYDAIIVEGAIVERPSRLLEQLKDRGRLVAVVTEGPLGKAVIWRRFGSTFDETAAFDATACMLPGFEKAPEFIF